MREDAPPPAQAAIRTDLGAIVSLELSRSAWLITSLSPGAGGRCPSTPFRRANVSGLLRRVAALRRKAAARTGGELPLVRLHEARADGGDGAPGGGRRVDPIPGCDAGRAVR